MIRRIVILMMVLSAANLSADMIPQAEVDEMCLLADAIVEATWDSGDRVEIEKIYHQTKQLPEGATALDIAGLGKHQRVFYEIGVIGRGQAIKTRKLIAFVRFDKDTRGWEPIHRSSQGGGYGSSGVIWLEGEKCYGYSQENNPGPLSLADREMSPERLAAEIKVGLKNAAAWRKALALRDKHRKAMLLAAYLFKKTSPPGDKGTYFHRVRDELPKLGAAAVPPLVELMEDPNLRSEYGMNTAVLVCHDIGKAAAAAVPALVKLLDGPGPPSHYYILGALQEIGDRTTVPAVRPFLNSADSQTRTCAAITLCIFLDLESADAIAKVAFDHAGDPNGPGEAVRIAEALGAMDRSAGMVLIEKLLKVEAMKIWKDSLRNTLDQLKEG